MFNSIVTNPLDTCYSVIRVASNRPTMLLWINCFLLIIFISLFSLNYAAIFSKIDNTHSFSEYYSRMRQNNFHRGILLSMNLEEQNEMCGDIRISQYLKVEKATWSNYMEFSRLRSGLARGDESFDRMVTKKMTSEGKLVAEEELFLICNGMRDGVVTLWNTFPFYISFAFEPRTFHVSRKNVGSIEVQVEQYVSMAPKNVPVYTDEIEHLYMNTLRNIDILRRESPQYVEMIEARDDIKALSRDERLALCASILSTSDNQFQGLVIHPRWVDGSEGGAEFIGNQPLSVWNEDDDFRPSSDNVLCRAWDTDSENTKDFYYTRSYNDKHSVFFIDKRDSGTKDEDFYFAFESYFENIPVLMNSKKNVNTIA